MQNVQRTRVVDRTALNHYVRDSPSR